MNETIEVLKNRCSLRKYDKKMVSDEHLDLILEMAMRAPTAGNMMPYSIIVIKDEQMKKKLSHTCDEQSFIENASVLLVFVADYQKWFDFYRINEVEKFCEDTSRSYKGPSEASLFLALEDALIAAQNAVIASESLGIGSCYIGDIMENYEQHQLILNLPKYAYPVAMLTLGYFPENHQKTLRPRFLKKHIVFNETYQSLDDENIKEMYQHLETRFSKDNPYQAKNYAQLHYAFKTNSEFSNEMTRSIREVLKVWNGEIK